MTAGVAVVDPAALERNTIPPPVAIEEVVIDDVETVKHSGTVTVPAGRHRIEIRFTALSLTAPEKLRFRYRLKGFDPEWVDAGTRRSAFFTAVEPGGYQFQVKGTNNDGVWSESDATLAVVVLPHYRQTGWFRAGVLALVSGLGVLGVPSPHQPTQTRAGGAGGVLPASDRVPGAGAQTHLGGTARWAGPPSKNWMSHTFSWATLKRNCPTESRSPVAASRCAHRIRLHAPHSLVCEPIPPTV